MLSPMLTELNARRFDTGAMLRSLGLDPAALQAPEARVPIEDAFELGTLAERVTHDPAFGLHLSERYEPNAFGIVDYLAHNSATLGEATEALCRFNRLLQDAIATRMELTEDTAIVWNEVPPSLSVPPGVMEYSIANLVVVGRELTGHFYAPLVARFRHAEPAYGHEHRRVFRCPVEFGADRDCVVLPRAVLDFPVRSPDLRLSAILQRHAQELLERTPRLERLRDRVLSELARELERGAPSAEQVAASLGMSERTLRRRLEEEATSWAELLDELRRGLAERYLADPTLSLEETALMLGYAESGAFRRAFRRWHAMSPGEFRKRALAGKGGP